jgi:hypothetical protein
MGKFRDWEYADLKRELESPLYDYILKVQKRRPR